MIFGLKISHLAAMRVSIEIGVNVNFYGAASKMIYCCRRMFVEKKDFDIYLSLSLSFLIVTQSNKTRNKAIFKGSKNGHARSQLLASSSSETMTPF
jgi:hypothetical protein